MPNSCIGNSWDGIGNVKYMLDSEVCTLELRNTVGSVPDNIHDDFLAEYIWKSEVPHMIGCKNEYTSVTGYRYVIRFYNIPWKCKELPQVRHISFKSITYKRLEKRRTMKKRNVAYLDSASSVHSLVVVSLVDS
jgi:hypothetical protein